MNAPEPLPAPRFLHDIPVEEVQAKKRWSREDWIVYAFDAMEHGGLGGVTIEELARRSNRTKGSFYAHFASRDELLEAMLEAWIEQKQAIVAKFDTELFHKGDFSIKGLMARVRGGRQTARPDLDIAIREWARMDERARATVMRLDMQRLNNGTAMLLAEFPKAPHPQVFALLLLWLLAGRRLIFIDPKQKELSESWDLAAEAFVRMYQATANEFKVPGAPSWKGHFAPIDLPAIDSATSPNATPRRKRRRR